MPYKDINKRREMNRFYYHKHKGNMTPEAKQKRRDNNKAYRKRHPALQAKKSREWRKTGAGKAYTERTRDRLNSHHRRYAEELTEAYLKKQLKKVGFSDNNIKQHPEIIDLYRQILKNKRLCKTSKNLGKA